jgi:hypothetical protein
MTAAPTRMRGQPSRRAARAGTPSMPSSRRSYWAVRGEDGRIVRRWLSVLEGGPTLGAEEGEAGMPAAAASSKDNGWVARSAQLFASSHNMPPPEPPPPWKPSSRLRRPLAELCALSENRYRTWWLALTESISQRAIAAHAAMEPFLSRVSCCGAAIAYYL